MVSHSNSRMQGGEAKTQVINLEGLMAEKRVSDSRQIGSGFGGCLEEIKSPDGELSRVESPPVNERSDFVGGAHDEDSILHQGTHM